MASGGGGMIKLPSNFPKDYMIEGIEIMEDRKLGEGAYGVVKLANYHGLTVAVKKLLPSFFPTDVVLNKLDEEAQIILESFFNECNKLSQIRHPNVIQLLGVTLDKETNLPAIVMELMHESLTHLLRRTSSLPLFVEVNITHDVAKALSYLHSAFHPPIVHRDLSSNNILVSRDYRAKVTDLGVSKVESSSFFQRMANTPAPGTMAYMAPEVRHIPADCSPAMDVFALGVIVIQVRSHKFPQPGPEQEKGKLGFPKTVPESERRHNHIKLIGRNHPLTKIALDSIKNSPKSRPSALDMCRELEKIQKTQSYEESKLACQIKDGEAERIREQISSLQQDLDRTRGELEITKVESERLANDLAIQQQQNQHLKEQLLGTTEGSSLTVIGANAAGGVAVGGASVSATDSKGLSKRIRSALKRKKKTKKTSTSSGGSKGGPAVPEEEEEEEEEIDDEESEEGYAVITNHALSEAERERNKRILKSGHFAWTSHRCLLEGLQGVTLHAYLSGPRLYLCGGATATGTPNTNVYYCPSKQLNSWSKLSQPTPQFYYASSVINRELIIIGGISVEHQKCTRQLLTYDLQESAWVEVLPPLPTARSAASAVTWGDYLIVLGGINNSSSILSTVEILHLPSQQWSVAFSLPLGVAGGSAVVYRSRLYIMGGLTNGGLSRAFFSVAMDRLLATMSRMNRLTTSSANLWEFHPDCPYTMMTLCVFNGYLLALGGNETTVSVSQPSEWVWSYFPDDDIDSWTLVQKMHASRKLCCATSLSSSCLVVIGGNPYFSVVDVARVDLPSTVSSPPPLPPSSSSQ